MEFDHVGKHCQYNGCNQKDFLPFTCDQCCKSFCLAHRSNIAHECSAGPRQDMTSIDCPLCGSSVKFDRSQDVNLVWDNHYMYDCNHQLEKNHTTKRPKCFKKGCNAVLGPSNTFTCSKCHQVVCLSHRLSEDHNCVGKVRKEFLEKFQKPHPYVESTYRSHHHSTNNTSSNFFLSPNYHQQHHEQHKKNTQKKSSAKRSSDSDIRSALKETAHRRMKHDASLPPPIPPNGPTHAVPPPPTNIEQGKVIDLTGIPTPPPKPKTPTLSCPFCGIEIKSNTSDAETALMAHINASHPEDLCNETTGAEAITSGDNTNEQSNMLFREVCPVCQARFAEPTELVIHYQTSHPEQSNNNSNNKCSLS